LNAALYFIRDHWLMLLVALLLVTALIFGGYDSCASRRYDKREAGHEAEKAQLKKERDAAIQKANEAEAKATILEVENAKTDELIEAQGGRIDAAKEKLDARIEEAKRGAGDCAAMPDPAAARDCTLAKLRALGL
jgi:hypothetical protein